MPIFSASPFFVCFAIFYVAHFCVEIGLILVNVKYLHKQKNLPSIFKSHISEETFAQSQSYTLAKQKLAFWQLVISAVIFWGVIFSGALNQIDKSLQQHFNSYPLSHAVLFCLSTGLLFIILNLPVQIYRIFNLEQRFGFNTMTAKLFLTDQMRSLILSLIIGVPILYLLFLFMQNFPITWWLWAFALIVSFQWLITALFPTWIAPFFNRFTPLPEGELKNHIESLAKAIQFKMSGVFTIDGSKRSQHSNAYFAGFGRWRRIVLFDTLVKQLTTEELLAVLAHEMGHNIKKHIFKSLLISTLITLVLFYVLGHLIHSTEFFSGFGLSPSTHAAIVLFALVSGVFLFPINPLLNALSRKHEFEADAFAAQVIKSSQPMQSALLKLTRDNLSQIAPHPCYSFFHYSHPTTAERLKALSYLAIACNDLYQNEHSWR